ncbi:MAG: hypothetical protein GY847_18405, partial [Proteobacteria bacterium]|nr:hypothetical protein [Pseudomonadota bacterium]
AQSQMVEGEAEGESTIEVMMETGGEDDDMDMTIAEQGKLPEPNGIPERLAYERLVSLEQSPIQFKFEAFFYLDSIAKVHQEACETRGEERLIQEAYPKIWAYFSLKSLLTRYEVENGKEDPDMPIAAQFAVVEKAYRIWKGQQTRA